MWKGIALVGREGRTLSPSGRGDGVGWGPPPLRGEGCPLGRGHGGAKILNHSVRSALKQ